MAMYKIPHLLLITTVLILSSEASQFCNATGCYNCFYRCQICSGVLANQCNSCSQNYILGNSTCFPCTQNCISCNAGVCQTCANGFYLAQSTGTCNACPNGALTCTFSAVQQCQSGYYLLNSACFYCVSNCLTCTNAYSCSQCQQGYYITAQSTCSICSIPNCSTCASDGTCSLCAKGFYGSNCTNICSANCDICDQSACYQCSSTYVMGASGCEAMSLLCSLGANFATCFQCVADISFMLGQRCVPYHFVHGANWQEYYTSVNNPDVLGISNGYCSILNLYFSWQNSALSFNVQVKPSYLLTISFQVLTPQTNSSTILVLSSPTLIQSRTFNVQSTQFYNCSNLNLTVNNFKSNFTTNFSTSNSSYSIQISIANQNGGVIGISQLLVEEWPCSINNCGICSTQTNCQQCLPNFYLQNNLCLSQCSQGYYLTQALQTCSLTCPNGYYPVLADYLCQACTSPCLTCTSPSSCSSCISGTFLSGSTCSLSCPSGTYSDVQLNQCKSCRYPCKDCINTSQTCSSCSLGYLRGSICMMTCPLGYFANLTSLSCQLCSNSCLTCSLDPSFCLSCKSTFYLQPNSTCLPSCDPGLVNVSGICTPCSHPCSTCSGTTSTCLSCSAGYLFNTTCLTLCPISYFGDISTKTCLLCPSQCQQCTSLTQCRSCSVGYYLYSNQSCLSQCPSGTLGVNSSCALCPQPCSSCDVLGCTACQGHFFVLFNHSCLLSCPIGTYISLTAKFSKICINCGSNCDACISSAECIKCTNNTVLEAGQCKNVCSSRYYPLNGNCIACIFPCLNCQGIDLCLSCQQGYYLDPQTLSCLSSCPSGKYNNNGTCLFCNSVCSLCKDASTSCLQCAIGYFKSASTGQCQVLCQSGYFSDHPQRTCRVCSSQCLTCLSQSSCLSCNSSSPYPYLHFHFCLATCPSGYYSSETFQCVLCDSTCSTCLNISTNCTSCPLSLLYTSSLSTCSQNCPSGFYNGGSGTCIPCNLPCLNCVSPTICLSCADMASPILNGKCLTGCPSGFFQQTINQSLKCSLCNVNCRTCNATASSCSSCPSDLYLLNGTCLNACPDGTYPDSISLACLPCNSPCSVCRSSSKCKSCINSYLLYLDSCLVVCPSGFYSSNTSSNCLVCVSPCSTCHSATLCSSCLKGYFFDSSTSQCLSTCPINTYAFQTSNGDMQCLACLSSCLSCFDGTACKSCNINSSRPYLQGIVCQSSCTQGYYSISANFTCQSCSQWCLSCTNMTNCLQCSSAYLLNGSCITQCPVAYYPSLANKCEMCISPCLTCYDGANCKTCISGYYLYLTHCLSNCPSNQWTVTSPNICNSTCLAPYFTITSNLTCTPSCSFYYSSSGQCLDICPTGLIANQTFGCQECVTSKCQEVLNYQVVQQQLTGVLRLVLVFNLQLDNHQLFKANPQNTLSVTLQTTEAPTFQELDITALRFLQQITPISFTVVDTQPQFLTIQLDFSGIPQPFSGKVHTKITDLSILTSSNYPIQATDNSLQIDWYQQSPQNSWSSYLSYILTVLFAFCVIVNFIFDNTKVVIPLTDVIQTIHFLFYIDAWNHPVLSHFMLGFRYAALRISLISSAQSIWNCSSKNQIVYGGCLFYSQILVPVMIAVILILSTVLMSKLKCFPKRSWISWGKIYIIWWLCLPSIAVSAFTYASSTAGTEFILACFISTLFGILSLCLGFQVIKNVYNQSYAEKTFFWNIRKKAGELANLHALLLVVRRICLVIGIGVNPQSPLGILFILTLLTIYIISNWLISKALKKKVFLQIVVEILFGVFMILLQMSIINATTLDNQMWNVFGWIMFLIIFAVITLLTVFAMIQTASCLSKNCQCLRKQEQSEKKSQKQSEEKSSRSQKTSKVNSEEGSSSKQKPFAEEDLTQQELLRVSIKTMNKRKRKDESKFSDMLESKEQEKKAAPKLIKLEKDPQPELQKEQLQKED